MTDDCHVDKEVIATGEISRATEKNIWMLWLQGADAAPPLVKVCHRSWIDRNPGWNVKFLSRETVSGYLSDEFSKQLFLLDLPPQKTANLIRLYLISRYGGVWADADCFCVRPLDDWLPELMAGGFFAFRFAADAWLEENRNRPVARLLGKSSDRILGNWFLAGHASNPISGRFLDEHLALLTAISTSKRRRRGVLRLATRLLRRNAYLGSRLSAPRLLKLAGCFPYFVFHYHFARLVLTDAEFEAAWKQVGHWSDANVIRYGKTMSLPVDPQFLEDFAGRGTVPVYKLHWKHVKHGAPPGSRYRWLIDQAGL